MSLVNAPLYVGFMLCIMLKVYKMGALQHVKLNKDWALICTIILCVCGGGGVECVYGRVP